MNVTKYSISLTPQAYGPPSLDIDPDADGMYVLAADYDDLVTVKNDLLEAAQKSLFALLSGFPVDGSADQSFEIPGEVVYAALDALRAAIAKAQGGSDV